ncbi:hypothetical protein B0H10DRAFT_2208942 [Mycena sp. CBHHK59/15]|nr:hypothetical protein B0H10DRAFT_2208942 [Mycena sp. CBHHK59/15]
MVKKTRSRSKPTGAQNSDEYRPGGTVAAQKKRRSEISALYYANNAAAIREKHRIQMAEKRAAIKARRRKSDRPANLTGAELVASRALAQMLERRRAASPLPPSSPPPVPSEEEDEQSDDISPAPFTAREHAIMCAKLDRGWKEQLAIMEEKGEPYVEEEEEEDAPAAWQERDDGEEEPLASVRGVSEMSDHQRCAPPATGVPEMSGNQSRAKLQRRSLRLPTPTSRSSSPEVQGKLPSFYEKLWAAVGSGGGTDSSVVECA